MSGELPHLERRVASLLTEKQRWPSPLIETGGRVAALLVRRGCNCLGCQQCSGLPPSCLSEVTLVVWTSYLRAMIEMRFTPHAKERMVQRQITAVDVESALADQVLSFTTRRGSLQIIGRTLYHQDGCVEGVSNGADHRSHHD